MKKNAERRSRRQCSKKTTDNRQSTTDNLKKERSSRTQCSNKTTGNRQLTTDNLKKNAVAEHRVLRKQPTTYNLQLEKKTSVHYVRNRSIEQHRLLVRINPRKVMCNNRIFFFSYVV